MVFKKGHNTGKDTRFEPGKSGNAKGAPTGIRMRTIIKKILEEDTTIELEDGSSVTMPNSIAVGAMLVKKAKEGNLDAIGMVIKECDSEFASADDGSVKLEDLIMRSYRPGEIEDMKEKKKGDKYE